MTKPGAIGYGARRWAGTCQAPRSLRPWS